MQFIDLKSQYRELEPIIHERINRVLEHGRYIMGPEVAELEERLASFVGTRHCVSVSSGTDALLISLMALGVGPGDEVITTPFSFISTVEVIVRLGARPVFVDIEQDTCNMDHRLLEGAVTPRTRAIMPVSLYGQVADMDEINAIAYRNGDLPVIEDGAQSFGASYKGSRSCGLSTIGCTSFFPSKPLGCYGDGGAIFTADDDLAQTCREIRVHGQSQRYVHTRIGVGGRLDTIQAAVTLAKLEGFDAELERRLEIGNRYNDLMDAHGVRRVQQRGDRNSVFAQYTVLVQDRDGVRQRFEQAGIPTAVHYPVPLCDQPAYQDIGQGGAAMDVARGIASRVLSVPMHARLSEADQRRCAELLVDHAE